MEVNDTAKNIINNEMTGTNKQFWITIPNVNDPNCLIQRHRGANQQEGSTGCHRWGKPHKIIYLDKNDKKLMAADKRENQSSPEMRPNGFPNP